MFLSAVLAGYVYSVMGNIDTAGRQPILAILGLTRRALSAYYSSEALSPVQMLPGGD
jgi:hypothetical protein